MIIEGKTKQLLKKLNSEMKHAALSKDFEKAARLRDQINAIISLKQKIIFGDKENIDITLDLALSDIAKKLNLKSIPARIEAYDISNLSDTDTVASMVVFIDGIPRKSEYRRFKMRTSGQNDFAMISEVIKRRLNKNWQLPDLMIIDGGAGQLSAALSEIKEFKIKLNVIGIAKKNEEIVVSRDSKFSKIFLPRNSASMKLIQRIRDEAHRFAITYHRQLRSKSIKKSSLEEIRGIGKMTRQKLILSFENLDSVKKATESQLAKIVGKSKARQIKRELS
jgi:excinuclease ABC subunit C